MGNVEVLVGVPGLDRELGLLEGDLRHSVATADPFLTEVASHLIGAGGKRIRPALGLAAAIVAGRGATEDVRQGGVAVELVHIGSLYHDDVLESADLRRGVPTVNARWGTFIAIISGDFLLARASEIAAKLGTEVAGLLAATIGRLCEGQILEMKTAFQVDRAEDDYLASIKGKTASLLSASARIGALTSGVDRTAVDSFTAFGEAFGMAFQIYDDVLDVTATEEELGKPVNIDMAGGVYTLPVLRALRDPVAGPELRRLLGSPLQDPELDKARSIVRSTSGIDEALTVARQYADDAAGHLASVPGADVLAGAAHRLLDGLHS